MCPYSFQMGGVLTNRKFEYNNDLKNQPVGWLRSSLVAVEGPELLQGDVHGVARAEQHRAGTHGHHLVHVGHAQERAL